MDIYHIDLAVLLFANAGLFLIDRRYSRGHLGKTTSIADKDSEQAPLTHDPDDDLHGRRHSSSSERDDHTTPLAAQSQVDLFKRQYYPAYLLAAAGDWLQGPHIFAIYKYTKELPETTVAALYATGFVAGAVSASLVGQIADRHGRRNACLLYCVCYAICCLAILSDNLTVLFIGRIFGGISTTLLFSVFDAWLITEYHARSLEAAGLQLGKVFGRLASLNSVVAIATGVLGELLVGWTGSRASPFLAATVVFVAAAGWIATKWNENYGHDSAGGTQSSFGAVASAARTMWKDKRVLALAVSSSIFESMMYLFVFFWSVAIKNARAAASIEADPPYGIIFSCFMCAMMAGSMLFTMSSRAHNVMSSSYILKLALTCASLCLMTATLTVREDLIFWAFCLVEMSIGLYFPSMSFLKSNIIEDGSRGRIYSLMRMPLNAIVVCVHSMAEEGDHHRNNVFLGFGAALLVAFIVLQKYID